MLPNGRNGGVEGDLGDGWRGRVHPSDGYRVAGCVVIAIRGGGWGSSCKSCEKGDSKRNRGHIKVTSVHSISPPA